METPVSAAAEGRREQTYWLLPAGSLWRREVVRFVRQRSRVIGALGTPLIFWLVIGSGLGRSFSMAGSAPQAGAAPEMDYLEYFFPGSLVLIVFFTAIFSTISVIQDRLEGFMQAILAAPVGRSAIVMGKVLGATTLALAQALVFLCLAPLAGISLSVGSAAAVAGVLTLVAIGLSGFGFLIAWPMESIQGFHAVMNLLLMPMWLLSGAVFPAGGASGWIYAAMVVNPITYHVAAVRHCLYFGSEEITATLPPLWLSLVITALLAVVTVAIAVRRVTRTA